MISKLKAYKEKISKDPKLFLIILLALGIAAIFAAEPILKNGTSFRIEDKCGKFINLMSHTIDDEDACKTRCRSQCESRDYRYTRSEFIQSNTGCNECMCYCR